MDEEIRLQKSQTGSPASSHNGRITVTIARPPPQNTLQQLTGGREDCWSQAATAILIQAWGERYTQLSRGNLKQNHWKEVADIVRSREPYTKMPTTDSQCKNRIDTVKKKYKMEKSKVMSGGASDWFFYHTLDQLIGHDAKNIPVPIGIPVKRQFSNVDLDPDPASTDSWGKSVRELSRAILKFGEAYEKAESSKMEQVVEMEKRRMKFSKELELKRMKCFMNTQLEISQLKRRKVDNDNNSDGSD